MEIPLPAYDDIITTNANITFCAKAERMWIAKIELQRLIKMVGAFLASVVEDTWLLPLKEEANFYNKVSLRNFFSLLKGGSSGLEATGIVSLLLATLGWWAEDPRVPEYTNRLEDAKKIGESNAPNRQQMARCHSHRLAPCQGQLPQVAPKLGQPPPRQHDVVGVENHLPFAPAHA